MKIAYVMIVFIRLGRVNGLLPQKTWKWFKSSIVGKPIGNVKLKDLTTSAQ